MTDQYLDEAAKVAGRADWIEAESNAAAYTLQSIRAHATTLAELAKAKDALAEIDAIAVHGRWSNLAGDLVAVAALAAPYRAKVDPLYEGVREALPGSMPDHHAAAITKTLRAAMDKRGLEIVAKDAAK